MSVVDGYDPVAAFDEATEYRGETVESTSWIPRFSTPRILGLGPGDVVDRVGIEPVERTMREWGDLNSPHNYPGVGHVLAADDRLGVLPPGGVNEDTYILQGVTSPYEAILQADRSVERVEVSYDFPVDSAAPLAMSVSDTGDSAERVTYIRPDVDERTATVDLTFTDDWRPNLWNAAKLPDSLGVTPKEGYILLGTEAEFGTGAGRQHVTEEIDRVQEKDGAPFDIYTSHVTYEDGTDVRHTLLGVDDAYQAAIGEFLGEEQDPLVGERDVRRRPSPPEFGWEMTQQAATFWTRLTSAATP